MRTQTLSDMLPFIEEAFSRGQAITIPVTGVSMRPFLEPGDSVTLAPIDENPIEQGDILLYRRPSGQFVLHRVVKISHRTITFCGDGHTTVEKNIPIANVVARVIQYQKHDAEYGLEEIRTQGCRRLRNRPVRALATWWHKHGKGGVGGLSAYRFLLRYLKQQLPAVIWLCILSCVNALAALGMALASGRVIDKALGNDLNNFREWFMILFALLIVVAVSTVAYSSIHIRACGKTRMAIRRDLFAVLLSKQYTAVKEYHSGEVLNRFTMDIHVVVENVITLIPHTLSIVTKLIGGLAFLLMVEPVFTSILIVGGVVLGAFLQAFSRMYKKIHKECQESEGKTRAYMQECVENMMVIKSFTGENDVLEKLDEHQKFHYRKQLRRNLFSNIGNTAIYSGFTFAYYSALAWGVLRIAGVIGNAMSVGTFAVLLQIMEQIRSPFRGVSGVLPQVYAMIASTERLLELEALPTEKRPPLGMPLEALYDQTSALVCEELTFAYEDDKTVFRDMTARFEKGKFTVIMGASGGGKTTLIKLLLGLVTPQKGNIFFEMHNDRIPISASTRGLFSFVPQGNMILSGSLYDNITFGNTEVSEEAVTRAVRMACLEETIASLPQGLQTIVGERGVGLSEGQIQRVSIARALLSDSPILLLDECTSALDAQTEKQLLASLRSIEDRTIIFISHRTAVLEQADEVVYVKNGNIAAQNET